MRRGRAGQVVLVALEGVDLEAVQREVDAQCDALPRGDTARQALSHSCIVRVDSQARPRRRHALQAPVAISRRQINRLQLNGLKMLHMTVRAHASAPDGMLRVQQVCGSCFTASAVRIVYLQQQSALWGTASAREVSQRHCSMVARSHLRGTSPLQSHVNCKRSQLDVSSRGTHQIRIPKTGPALRLSISQASCLSLNRPRNTRLSFGAKCQGRSTQLSGKQVALTSCFDATSELCLGAADGIP